MNLDKPNQDKRTELSYYNPSVNPDKLKLLTNYVRPNSILDVGCGNGLYSLSCHNTCPDIFQIDLLDRRNKHAVHLPFRAMDAEDILAIGNSFDNIIAFDLIEHLDDDTNFLKSAYQLLNSGGRFFVSVPNEDNSLLDQLHLAHIHFTDKTHRREYSSTSLRQKLEDAGFYLIEVVPHVNRSITNLPRILAKRSLFSRITAKILSYQIRGLEKMGVLENNVVPDWFGVAQKK